MVSVEWWRKVRLETVCIQDPFWQIRSHICNGMLEYPSTFYANSNSQVIMYHVVFYNRDLLKIMKVLLDKHKMSNVPYSTKLWREKTLADLVVYCQSAKVLSAKMLWDLVSSNSEWALPLPTAKVFSAKTLWDLASSNSEWALPLPTAKVFSTNFLAVPIPPKFSPAKVLCYTVLVACKLIVIPSGYPLMPLSQNSWNLMQMHSITFKGICDTWKSSSPF